MEGGNLRALDYETQLNNMKAAQQRAAVADLENTRNQALSNLKAEQQQNAGTFNAKRSSANAQNRLGAKNFQEYLASTGRANSGLGAQARMQYNNNLNTNINALNAGEAAALADINRRTTDAQNAYNSGLASANANIEANYIQNLLNERNKELERQFQERQFQEQIRQFNENLALQKAQLYSKSSGSGGGYGGYNSSGYDEFGFTDTPGAVNNSGYTNDMGGMIANAVYNAPANSKAKKTTKKTTKKSSNPLTVSGLQAARNVINALTKKR